MALANSSPLSWARRSIHARSAASSGLSGWMRCPPECGNAGRGLSEKQRIRGILRIDQYDQRFPEGLDPVGRRALLRKLKAGGRRNAIGIVTAAASGFFEDGVDRFGKRGGVGGHPNRRAHTEYPDQQPRSKWSYYISFPLRTCMSGLEDIGLVHSERVRQE